MLKTIALASATALTGLAVMVPGLSSAWDGYYGGYPYYGGYYPYYPYYDGFYGHPYYHHHHHPYYW